MVNKKGTGYINSKLIVDANVNTTGLTNVTNSMNELKTSIVNEINTTYDELIQEVNDGSVKSDGNKAFIVNTLNMIENSDFSSIEVTDPIIYTQSVDQSERILTGTYTGPDKLDDTKVAKIDAMYNSYINMTKVEDSDTRKELLSFAINDDNYTQQEIIYDNLVLTNDKTDSLIQIKEDSKEVEVLYNNLSLNSNTYISNAQNDTTEFSKSYLSLLNLLSKDSTLTPDKVFDLNQIKEKIEIDESLLTNVYAKAEYTYGIKTGYDAEFDYSIAEVDNNRLSIISQLDRYINDTIPLITYLTADDPSIGSTTKKYVRYLNSYNTFLPDNIVSSTSGTYKQINTYLDDVIRNNNVEYIDTIEIDDGAGNYTTTINLAALEPNPYKRLRLFSFTTNTFIAEGTLYAGSLDGLTNFYIPNLPSPSPVRITKINSAVLFTDNHIFTPNIFSNPIGDPGDPLKNIIYTSSGSFLGSYSVAKKVNCINLLQQKTVTFDDTELTNIKNANVNILGKLDLQSLISINVTANQYIREVIRYHVFNDGVIFLGLPTNEFPSFANNITFNFLFYTDSFTDLYQTLVTTTTYFNPTLFYSVYSLGNDFIDGVKIAVGQKVVFDSLDNGYNNSSIWEVIEIINDTPSLGDKTVKFSLYQDNTLNAFKRYRVNIRNGVSNNGKVLYYQGNATDGSGAFSQFIGYQY